MNFTQTQTQTPYFQFTTDTEKYDTLFHYIFIYIFSYAFFNL